MKPLALTMALLTLAACGADGEPVRPAADHGTAPSTGVTISGEARFGVTKSI